jgi:predicted ATPase
LLERRKQLHERIGAALEQLSANSIDDHLDKLAHHYGRSGNVAKALEFYDRAGRQAVQRSAYGEAMRSFTSALELLQRIPPGSARDQREFALQTSLGPVLMATKGWAAPETERVYLRAHELVRNSGTAEQRFSLLVGWFGLAYVGGSLSVARERLKETLDFLKEHPEPAFVLEACHHQWSAALSGGELDAAQRHVETGLALYEAKLRSVHLPLYSAHHPAVCGHGWGAMVLWLRGFPDAAQRQSQQAVSLARELEDALSFAWALGARAQVHQLMGEVRPALETAEAAITKAEEIGFPYILLHSRIAKGWALAELDRAEEGADLIQEAIAALTAARAGVWLTWGWVSFIAACGRAGRVDEGLKAAAEALKVVRQNGECCWEAEIHRLRGELLLRQSDSNRAEARACFELAIQIAETQGAKSLDLRAKTSLARLLASQGRRDEARGTLAPIYEWFTEGFDTGDLKDAKALLDELNS